MSAGQIVGVEHSRIRVPASRAASAYLQVWRAKTECTIGASQVQCHTAKKQVRRTK
jgi:hypothetical protein